MEKNKDMKNICICKVSKSNQIHNEIIHIWNTGYLAYTQDTYEYLYSCDALMRFKPRLLTQQKYYEQEYIFKNVSL